MYNVSKDKLHVVSSKVFVFLCFYVRNVPAKYNCYYSICCLI